MMADLADRTLRPAARRASKRKMPAGPKAVRAPAKSMSEAAHPASAPVATEVMAVLAAFGLED